LDIKSVNGMGTDIIKYNKNGAYFKVFVVD